MNGNLIHSFILGQLMIFPGRVGWREGCNKLRILRISPSNIINKYVAKVKVVIDKIEGDVDKTGDLDEKDEDIDEIEWDIDKIEVDIDRGRVPIDGYLTCSI